MSSGGSRRPWILGSLPGVVLGLALGYNMHATSGVAAVNQAKNCNTNATGTPVGAGRYTPGPTGGAVTPLPNKTPLTPKHNVILGMISHPLHVVTTAQKNAAAGKKGFGFYLYPNQVVRHTLPQYGFKPPINLVSPAKPFPRYSGRPVRKAVVKYKGTLYQVRVAQPAKQGHKGIWMIVTILRQSVRLGGIGQPAKVVEHAQHLADTRKMYAFYRNPNQVALKDAPQYGLLAPVKMVSKATPFKSTSGRPTRHVVISAQGTKYDVYVAQFGKTGPKGVWSYSFVDVHQR